MTTEADVQSQIDLWRGYLMRHGAISAVDAQEMEDHLREQMADLVGAGLSEDEAFVIAIKRMGSVDELSREFAREHSDRLWKQLVLTPAGPHAPGHGLSGELAVVLALAVGSAVAVKAGLSWLDGTVFVRNLSLLVLPFLTGYFGWKRRISGSLATVLCAAYVVAALVLNVYPYDADSDTGILAAIHLPIVLWLVVGAAYVSGQWRSDRRRMDFIRFTGEFLIYYTLLGLGGGVLIGLTVSGFATVGADISWFVADWVLPVAMPGAVLVAAWLVEAKQDVVENIAPVLTRVFTPLTIVMLLALLTAYATTRSIVDTDRTLLILMDLILVLVLGLLLYAISARDPVTQPGLFDWLQLMLVLCALLVDVVMLTAMLTRIAEFGSSPNKVAALGMNLVLLVSLCGSAWLSLAFLRGRRGSGALERWQTRYLPVYGGWAAAVVVLLPLVFSFR